MIKKLICLIWGHKIREKAYTGNKVTSIHMMGFEYDTLLYNWKYNTICPRCGKKLG